MLKYFILFPGQTQYTIVIKITISYKQKQWRPPSKKKKRGKHQSPRNKKACHKHRHCPPEKRRGDRNPKCHEEQQKDVA
jgi:hypothetical protein